MISLKIKDHLLCSLKQKSAVQSILQAKRKISTSGNVVDQLVLPNATIEPFPGEYSSPKMITEVPGPKSKELFKQLDKFQDARTQHFFVDYAKSKGNYVVDADGNIMLDILCSIASHAIGYNHPSLIEAAKSDQWITHLVNRPATGVQPSTLWPSTLEKTLLSVAPKGTDQLFTAMCGSCANECAFKAVFMAYQHRERGGKPFSAEELSSCMRNESPGSPSLSILSFKGAFHGRLFGTLSTTRSKPLHKIDVPAFNWPQASFPKLKYPEEDFQVENQREEARCLTEVEHLIKTHPVKVAGMIIEPIQGEGGDNSASPSFFHQLRTIAKNHNVFFIVDEVQTGVGATGSFWAHEQWHLDNPPDIVTFSKKMQAAGFYHSMETRPSEGYRNFNTWLGDPVRAMQAGVIIEEIQKRNLIRNVQVTGAYLKDGLNALQRKYPRLLSNVRGKGTFLAFDMQDIPTQVKLLAKMRQKGVEATGSGQTSIRIRPMLIFMPAHARQFLSILEDCIKDL